MADQLTLLKGTAPRLGPPKAGVCGICGLYKLETRTSPYIREGSKREVEQTIQRTVRTPRKRRGKIAYVAVPQIGRRKDRIPICSDCRKEGRRKSSRGRAVFGVTRLSTYNDCPERYYWERHRPSTYEQFRGVLTHAVLAWYTRHGSLDSNSLWSRQGPLGIKEELLHNPRFQETYHSLEESLGSAKIDEALLFAVDVLKTLVKWQIVRTKLEWYRSGKHKPLKVDFAAPENPFRVTLRDLANYCQLELPERYRQLDIVLPGAVDMEAFYEGPSRKQHLDQLDYKTFMVPEEHLDGPVYPLQQRIYGLIGAMRFGIPLEKIRERVSPYLVFVVPGQVRIKPCSFKDGDAAAALNEVYQAIDLLTQAAESRAELGDSEVRARFFAPKQGLHCDYCPAKKQLCSYWNPGRVEEEVTILEV